MLLPQSSAFAALKNRLNSVSSIGYLHSVPRPYVLPPGNAAPPFHSRQGLVAEVVQSQQQQQQLQQHPPLPRSKLSMDAHALPHSNATTPSGANFDRPNRLKGREEGIIRWNELLEKFRSVQERARRAQRPGGEFDDMPGLGLGDLRIMGDSLEAKSAKDAAGRAMAAPPVPLKDPPTAAAAATAKVRSGLGRQFGRLGGAVSGRNKRGQP